MMTGNEIRQAFLDFFAQKQHTIVPSAPMVIKNDPTLMFTNAGMNQFKDIFLGNVPRKHLRAADSQKCLRVSGKHNDLEEVGHDTYHHTMFEMLGNWSFGDYFKQDAIAWAWELLTKVYKLPEKDLYVTVFGGDKEDNLGLDTEALEYWKEWVSEEHILKGSKKDNFWEMGDQGPCGPCSEIHIDLRDEAEKRKVAGRDLVNKDHPQVVEIWNLVFMQFNRLADGKLVPLSQKHIDTGMGFERLCMAIQAKKSNYDTDIFQPLIQFLAKLSHKTYGEDHQSDVALRVCADHIRAVAFAIADGQLPSNAKAGYVIRRILRRAVRYGYTFLGLQEPFLHLMVSELVKQLHHQFPELKAQEELIKKVVFEEELSFLRTLANGIQKFEHYIAKQKDNRKVIDGHFAFELFDTYGFPIDLTELMAKEQGFSIDMNGFLKGLEQQKQRSRQDASVNTDDWVVLQDINQTKFLGYDKLSAPVKISRYRKVRSKGKEFYQLVFDQTPFYAEMGGQVGDTGYLDTGVEKISITDTKKENNLPIHLTDKLPQDPAGEFIATVDIRRRNSLESNHSATHLLHHALRKVLGTHVEQKGSLVEPDYLRFDFSHFSKMTDEEIRKVEKLVNEMVQAHLPIEEYRDLSMEDALDMGAMALFGEKYDDKVRVIRFGDAAELCGGTHVRNSAYIGMFKIRSESSVAAGVRRIEAITGKNVENYIYELNDTLAEIKNLYGNPPQLLAVLKKNIAEAEADKQLLDSMKKEQVNTLFQTLKTQAQLQNGIHIIEFLSKDFTDGESLKDLAHRFRSQSEPTAFIGGVIIQDKPMIILSFTDDLVSAGKNAGKIIKDIAKEIQGGGGGQPFLASAGGKNTDGIQKAIAKAKELILA